MKYEMYFIFCVNKKRKEFHHEQSSRICKDVG